MQTKHLIGANAGANAGAIFLRQKIWRWRRFLYKPPWHHCAFSQSWEHEHASLFSYLKWMFPFSKNLDRPLRKSTDHIFQPRKTKYHATKIFPTWTFSQPGLEDANVNYLKFKCQANKRIWTISWWIHQNFFIWTKQAYFNHKV